MRALRPISNVINQVKTITINNLNQRVNEGNRKDEIAQMAITFNEILQRIEDAFILQREFVRPMQPMSCAPHLQLWLRNLIIPRMQERDKKSTKEVIKSISRELKS